MLAQKQQVQKSRISHLVKNCGEQRSTTHAVKRFMGQETKPWVRRSSVAERAAMTKVIHSDDLFDSSLILKDACCKSNGSH